MDAFIYSFGHSFNLTSMFVGVIAFMLWHIGEWCDRLKAMELHCAEKTEGEAFSIEERMLTNVSSSKAIEANLQQDADLFLANPDESVKNAREKLNEMFS